MQDLRKRLFIMVSVAVAIVIVLTIFFIVRNRNRNLPTPEKETTFTEFPAVETEEENFVATPLPIFADQPAPTKSESPDEQYVQQIAKIFVERANSYSNQNNNRHIDDVESLATSRMMSYLKTQALEQDESYAGVTTRVIASSVSSLSATNAEVKLGVQQYFAGEGAPEPAYKSGRVSLLFVGGDWKVNGVFWGEEE